MELLSTGQVAKALQVAPRTVSKWIDNGTIVGHKLPGSSNRRVRMGDLVRFAREYGMPLKIPDAGKRFSILLVGVNQALADAVQEQFADCVFHLAETAYEVGQRTASHFPHAAVVDYAIGSAAAGEVCKHLAAENIRLLVLLPEDVVEVPLDGVETLRQPVGRDALISVLAQWQIVKQSRPDRRRKHAHS